MLNNYRWCKWCTGDLGHHPESWLERISTRVCANPAMGRKDPRHWCIRCRENNSLDDDDWPISFMPAKDRPTCPLFEDAAPPVKNRLYPPRKDART